MRAALMALALLAPTTVLADVPEALDRIGPAWDRFSEATAVLDAAATEDCRPEALRQPWEAAFDAWLAVAHFRLGPAETDGRSLAIAFWPDPKGQGLRVQKALLAGDPASLTVADMAAQSVAARGFFALERLLFGDALSGDTCALTRATAADLARTAASISAEWPAYDALLRSAGAEGNTVFLAPEEARQALLTQLVSELDFIADQRIGRPLGDLARPRAELAEARASGRSLHHVRLSLAALRDLARDLAPDAAATRAALDRAVALADRLDDPVFAGVADPQGWLKVEILQAAVRAARDTAAAEVGAQLGVGLGFNSQDGD
jgi:uncharacterized protein